MLSWISKIYSNPTAQVKVNGILSEPFSITNGTRQRCPLYPFFFFALSLEPLLYKIYLNPDITGLNVGGVQYKAHTDYMLFFLDQSVSSSP